MTKLTTERLEYYAALPTQPAEGDGFFKKSIFMYEVRRMARQILAYEQAAKNPVAWTSQRALDTKCQIVAFTDKDSAKEYGEKHGWEGISPVFLSAPVLPKQPDATLTDEGDITKIVKAAEKLVRCKGRYHSEQNYRALAALFGVTVPDLPPLPADEAPAQPVIPEGLLQAINRLLDNDGSRGKFSAVQSYDAREDLERLLAPIAQQNEPQNIPENIPAQPVSEPYKFPQGWKLVPIEPTAAMFHAFNDCDYGRKSMRERYIQMIEAAPAQESE